MYKYLMLFFLSFIPFVCFSQKYNSSFQISGVKYKAVKIDNQNYTQLLLNESSSSGNVGDPDLPVFYKTFYIPKNLQVTDIIFKSYKEEELQLSFDLMPIQQPIPTGFSQINRVFNKPNEDIYNVDKYYPERDAEICRTDYFDGDIQLVTIKVSPIKYHPKLRKLLLNTEWEIILNTVSAPSLKSNSLKMVKEKFHDEKSIDVLKTLIVNPQDVSIENNIQLKASNQSAWSVPFYEYVIITSNTLKPAFNEFLAWKKRKGYNAGVVCIEDILNDPAAVGDGVSRLYDDAGKLRQYLSDSYYAGVTKYALLGGDYNIVPIRYGCAGDNTWDYGTSLGARKIPSDLYFSDFNGNWNVDNDVYTGEQTNDAVDYAPEIYVGRILCNNEIDIKNWVYKALKYELNPGNGDYTYLSKWLASQADQLQYYQKAEAAQSYLPSIFETKKIMNELPSYTSANPTYPTGPQVIAELNQNYGLYTNFNHGGAMGFGTASQSSAPYGEPVYGHDVHSNVVAVDAYDLNDSYFYSARPDSKNGFDNLTNINYPTIIYSVSCTNMPFDDKETPDNCRNLAEAFMCMNLSGGPAYLGNTGLGWVSASCSLYNDFLKQVKLTPSLGKAEGLSKFSFSYYIDYKHWLMHAHNLAGCPEMPMWTVTPSRITSGITESGSRVYVSTGGITVDKICVRGAVNSDYCEVRTNVSSLALFYNVPKPYYVTVTKDNYIPYLNSLGDVYVQNEYFSSITYLNSQNIYAGFSVTSDIYQGNVVVPNGANVVFDAVDDIILDAGFEVQLGGFFEAK